MDVSAAGRRLALKISPEVDPHILLAHRFVATTRADQEPNRCAALAIRQLNNWVANQRAQRPTQDSLRVATSTKSPSAPTPASIIAISPTPTKPSAISSRGATISN